MLPPRDDDTITLCTAAGQSTAAGAASEAAPACVVPRRIGPVELLYEIGRGAQSAVWRGRHTLLARDVAVKFYLAGRCTPDEARRSPFLAGARAAANVRHPGLNAILHADWTDGVPYLVMEFVNGPTLTEALARLAPLPEPAVLAILESLCEAVEALHAAGVVHRDIKLSNVMLDPEGQVLLTDFGLALPDGGGRGLAPAGTPAYMAPEMFEGVVSPRSDVFALGVFARRLLGDQAGEGATPGSAGAAAEHAPSPGAAHGSAVAAAHLEEPPKEAPLAAVLRQATHANPLFRYKTAGHLLRAWRTAVGDAGVFASGRRTLELLLDRWRQGDTAPPGRQPAVDPTPSSGTLARLLSRKRGEAETPPTASPAAPARPPTRSGSWWKRWWPGSARP